MKIATEILSLTAAVLSAAVLAAPERPYEMELAGRDQDAQTPLLRLADAAGWTVQRQTAAEATLSQDAEHALFAGDDGSLKLSYKATGDGPVIEFGPVEPVKIAAGFDTVSVWIYGNNIYGSPVPATRCSAVFADAQGERFEVKFIDLRHREWFLLQQRLTDDQIVRAKNGATFIGFKLENGTNRETASLSFASLAVFTEVLSPLTFSERAQALASPDPDGMSIVPPCAEPHSELEFRFPKQSLDWSELAFRWKGSAWIPLAKGGGLFPAAAAKGASVKFSRVGDSVVAEISTPSPGVEEVSFGGIYGAPSMRRFAIPYLTYRCSPAKESTTFESRPCVLSTVIGQQTLFIAAHFDWTYSGASMPYTGSGSLADGSVCANWGVYYHPNTAGVRNPVRERFVWTVSPEFAAVLPSIPHSPSEWHDRLGNWVWRAHGVGQRSKDLAFYRQLRDLDLTNVIVTDHETGWRDGEESFTFRTFAAPKKGGDEGQAQYARDFIDGLGYKYGIYDNFTDLAPVNANWAADHAKRQRDGNFEEAWYRCYQPKAAFALEMSEKLSPEIQQKFNLNCVYCDVHTATTPWVRTDYDARVPGAASFLPFYRTYCEILSNQKRFFNGPVFSEGGVHWMYAGCTDGNFALDIEYKLYDHPWLVDFDLRRIHDQEVDFGVGMASETVTDETTADRYHAATIAFGHGAYFFFQPDSQSMVNAFRSYYQVRPLAAHYTKSAVRGVLYGARAAKPVPIEQASQDGRYQLSQVIAKYEDGTLTVANGSASEPLAVKLRQGWLTLPPYGFYGTAGEGTVGVWSGELNGKRCDLAVSPEAVLVWGRGNFISFPSGGSDGLMVRQKSDQGEEQVLVANATVVELPYVATSADVEFEIVDGKTRFKPSASRWAYKFHKGSGFTEPTMAENFAGVYVAEKPKLGQWSAPATDGLPISRGYGVIVRGQQPETLTAEVAKRTGAQYTSTMSAKTCGGEQHLGIYMHPACIAGNIGSVYMQYFFAIPKAGAVLDGFMGKLDGSGGGDGILFKVVVVEESGHETVVCEKTVDTCRWEPFHADLTPWKGKTIAVRLVSDPGPADNCNGDWSAWGDLKYIGGNGTLFNIVARE